MDTRKRGPARVAGGPSGHRSSHPTHHAPVYGHLMDRNVGNERTNRGNRALKSPGLLGVEAAWGQWTLSLPPESPAATPPLPLAGSTCTKPPSQHSQHHPLSPPCSSPLLYNLLFPVFFVMTLPDSNTIWFSFHLVLICFLFTSNFFSLLNHIFIPMGCTVGL